MVAIFSWASLFVSIHDDMDSLTTDDMDLLDPPAPPAGVNIQKQRRKRMSDTTSNSLIKSKAICDSISPFIQLPHERLLFLLVSSDRYHHFDYQ